jgi:ribosomal protein S18 acetylase RimI-like enzyme
MLESRRFGMTIGRLNVPRQTKLTAAAVIEMLRDAPVDLIVLRTPAEFVDWPAALIAAEVVAIPADTLLYYEKPLLSTTHPIIAAPIQVELGELTTVVHDTFDEYRSHYSACPLFPSTSIRDGYVEWAQSFLNGSAATTTVTVVREGRVAGFSCVYNDNPAEVALIGVAPQFRRQGVYDAILAETERIAAGRSDRLVISTQVTNRASLRGWHRRNYDYAFALSTFHVYRVQALASLRALPVG